MKGERQKPAYPFGQRGGAVPDAPNRMHPGLKSLDLAWWLICDENFDAERALKKRLLAEDREQVLQVRPQSVAAQNELCALVADHLNRPAPDCPHGIESAGLMAQEDFCILEQNPMGRYELTAACVCFPSRWDLLQKTGKTLSAIHAPVPGYAETLANPLNRLFHGLRVERPVWRQNWALDTNPDLHQPRGHGREDKGADLKPGDIGTAIWLRSEYQTLRRLPKTGAIVFTIRNFVWPLTDVADKAAKQRLADQLATMPLAMSDYKSVSGYKEAAIAYLTRD